MVTGSCLCGSLRYEVEGPFDMMLHCHCSMCRKHHGSAFATFVAAPMSGFRWRSGQESLRAYQSSPHGRRFFCGTCASVAPTLAPPMNLVFLPAANLEGELGIHPQAHIFVASKAPWHTITDQVPQHAEYPPQLGLSGLTRPTVEPREGLIQGSCLCGAVGYEIDGKPSIMINCYCSRCRRARSAAFATNMLCEPSQFRWTRGEEQVELYRLPGAKSFGSGFCRTCGGSVPRFKKEADAMIVPCGSLDTDPGIRPAMHIFVADKVSWIDIGDDLPQHEGWPGN